MPESDSNYTAIRRNIEAVAKLEENFQRDRTTELAEETSVEAVADQLQEKLPEE